MPGRATGCSAGDRVLELSRREPCSPFDAKSAQEARCGWAGRRSRCSRFAPIPRRRCATSDASRLRVYTSKSLDTSNLLDVCSAGAVRHRSSPGCGSDAAAGDPRAAQRSAAMAAGRRARSAAIAGSASSCSSSGSRRTWSRTTWRSSGRAGIVSARRSSADGRDVYYRADLFRCRDLLGEAGRSLHPGLSLAPTPPDELEPRRARPRLLFLCTGNSARSQIAEALVEHRSAGTVEARSAGSHPKPLHPNAVRVMAERGDRHLRPPDEVAHPLHPQPVRPGHHALRQGARDLPGVPGGADRRALEHRRPRRRRRRRPGDVSRVRTGRRRDRRPRGAVAR